MSFYSAAAYFRNGTGQTTHRQGNGQKAGQGAARRLQSFSVKVSEKNQHWGSTLDDFLHEEGISQAAKAAAARVISWQIAEEMRKQGITKTQMAERMQTSRAQVDSLLKAKGNVTIETLQRATALVGREPRLELVEIGCR